MVGDNVYGASYEARVYDCIGHGRSWLSGRIGRGATQTRPKQSMLQHRSLGSSTLSRPRQKPSWRCEQSAHRTRTLASLPPMGCWSPWIAGKASSRLMPSTKRRRSVLGPGSISSASHYASMAWRCKTRETSTARALAAQRVPVPTALDRRCRTFPLRSSALGSCSHQATSSTAQPPQRQSCSRSCAIRWGPWGCSPP